MKKNKTTNLGIIIAAFFCLAPFTNKAEITLHRSYLKTVKSDANSLVSSTKNDESTSNKKKKCCKKKTEQQKKENQ